MAEANTEQQTTTTGGESKETPLKLGSTPSQTPTTQQPTQTGTGAGGDDYKSKYETESKTWAQKAKEYEQREKEWADRTKQWETEKKQLEAHGAHAKQWESWYDQHFAK